MASVAAMNPPRPARRYTLGAIAFHWAIAVLILLNIYLGWHMNRIAGLDRFSQFQLHKSVGITVLALSVLRVAWRLAHRPPPYPASMSRWERLAATATHWSFYALMLIMPLTGWVIVSASALNLPTLLYKTIPLAHIGFVHDQPMPVRLAIEGNFGTTHVLLAYLFGALILLHIAAALKHQFVQGDGVLLRMLPGRSAPQAAQAR
ncbi:cytochrome b [Sphingomonas bacterium]|uniref:cytochrome b n=1 Tax=Sphingomonas bacterium TaxID=1895847 RepID=UPI001C2D2C79|nr:cytochrome b [Sphingomonas bacterium]